MLLRDQNVLPICNSLWEFEDTDYSILILLDSVNHRELQNASPPFSFGEKKIEEIQA